METTYRGHEVEAKREEALCSLYGSPVYASAFRVIDGLELVCDIYSEAETVRDVYRWTKDKVDEDIEIRHEALCARIDASDLVFRNIMKDLSHVQHHDRYDFAKDAEELLSIAKDYCSMDISDFCYGDEDHPEFVEENARLEHDRKYSKIRDEFSVDHAALLIDVDEHNTVLHLFKVDYDEKTVELIETYREQ